MCNYLFNNGNHQIPIIKYLIVMDLLSILCFHCQIFMLNTRLAAAESMTHDVIRDLLGVKLDMTSYAVSLEAFLRF